MTNVLEGMMSDIKSLLKRVSHLEARRTPTWVYLASPLTSTSWDGDSFSTTAKTKIDLSTVFGVPAGIKAVMVTVHNMDSGSAANDCLLLLSNSNSAGVGQAFRCSGQTNDSWSSQNTIIPCDTAGDIYYQITASGASTMDIHINIWGYLI